LSTASRPENQLTVRDTAGLPVDRGLPAHARLRSRDVGQRTADVAIPLGHCERHDGPTASPTPPPRGSTRRSSGSATPPAASATARTSRPRSTSTAGSSTSTHTEAGRTKSDNGARLAPRHRRYAREHVPARKAASTEGDLDR